MQMGHGQNYQNYESTLGAMANPQAYINKLMQGYSESPQAKQAQQQGIQTANAATAATGMQGSGAEQTALQKQGQQISQADQQNYLNNMLGVAHDYLNGLGGLEQQGMTAGLNATENYGDISAQLAKAYADAQAKQAQSQQQGKNTGIGTALGTGYDLFNHIPLVGNVASVF